MDDERERLLAKIAKNLAKQATGSDRVALMVVRLLRAHYEERRQSVKGSATESVLSGITYICDNLIEDFEMYESTLWHRKYGPRRE